MNIFRPRVNHKKPLNVVVFAHGGGLYSGNNNPLLYGPDFFMETGQVILVTISYRLNAFGFLATGDLASPGNYGLKDMTMALRWVNRHIGAFGGDPNSITFMGHSAGSTSVNYHIVSRHSEGLYKNAILISGTVNTAWAVVRERPRDYVNHHARALGIKNAADLSSDALVEVLRRIPAKDLCSTVQSLYQWDNLPVAAYLPVVEPFGSPDAFLTEHPKVSLATGNIVKVPILATTIAGDGINLVHPIIRLNSRYEEFNKHIYKLLPVVLEMNPHHPNMTEIVNRVRFKYFGRRGVVTPSNFDSVIQMASHYHFGRPFYADCQSMAEHTPLYAHQFNYRGLNSVSVWYAKSPRNFGVVHGDDLLYLFRLTALFPYQLSPEDMQVQKAFMSHIMSFIKYNYPGYPQWDVMNPKMVRFSKSNVASVKIDQVPVNPYDFWREIEDLYRPIPVWSGSNSLADFSWEEL